MTQEDRERIHAYAQTRYENYPFVELRFKKITGFIKGSEYEHPIAYNRALEDAIRIVSQVSTQHKVRAGLLEQLEKLKV